jgi:predicted Zn-dependent protease with MMP-like domain
MPYHVSKAEFAAVVEQVLQRLPEQFRGAVDETPIEILDRPSSKLLRSLDLEDDELLMGLYTGVPLTERSVEHSGRMPDKILLFQEDIELVSDSEKQLKDEIRITLLHEIGHYFGMDEDDLEKLGYG